jgi:hypothetical protein
LNTLYVVLSSTIVYSKLAKVNVFNSQSKFLTSQIQSKLEQPLIDRIQSVVNCTILILSKIKMTANFYISKMDFGINSRSPKLCLLLKFTMITFSLKSPGKIKSSKKLMQVWFQIHVPKILSLLALRMVLNGLILLTAMNKTGLL